jgi:predicted site-specific integrase-resolvase
MQDGDKVYDITARGAAARLGVCEATVKRMARAGKVQARKNVSGYWLFAAEDLDALPIHSFVEPKAGQ